VSVQEYRADQIRKAASGDAQRQTGTAAKIGQRPEGSDGPAQGNTLRRRAAEETDP